MLTKAAFFCSFPSWSTLCVSTIHLFAVVNIFRPKAPVNVFTELVLFPVSVKCIKNTPGYFAERLYKAMKVRSHVPSRVETTARVCSVVICAV